MSTFSGKMGEIPDISIDRFEIINRTSKAFFLSHCHTDHCEGLAWGGLKLPGPLYMSEISAEIVRQKYPNVENIHCLEIGGNLNQKY